jgi:hypothetical protein
MQLSTRWIFALTLMLACVPMLPNACGGDGDKAAPTALEQGTISAEARTPSEHPTNPGNEDSNEDASDAAPFEPLEGEWVGMWNNETFNTTAPITLSVTFNDDATVSMMLGLSSTQDGSPFGLAAVEPSMLDGSIEGEILTVEAFGHPVFGNITISIVSSGTLEALATMDGVDGVSGLEVNGFFDQYGLDANYTITFPDGSEAVGTAYLDRV